MLKIDEDQLALLHEVRSEALLEEVFRFARRELTECVAHLSDEALRTRLDDHAGHAKRFGIRDPERLFEFLGLALFCGEPPFYLEPEALPHFAEEDADPEEQTRLMLLDIMRLAREEIG